MGQRYPFVSPKCPHLWHGGDYNPEQWARTPGIWDEDLRLMRLAGVNALSVGIFAWTALEPEEGRFEFGWLDRIMDRLAANGAFAILATPSGARPAWLSQRYPEVLRVREDGHRNRHGTRHNHCYSSPVYREKVAIINGKLAERYGQHPAMLLWHLSNEYGGQCYCQLCQAAFREWLKSRYQHDLDKLNHAWWSAFWSHTYTAWEQLEAPGPNGESATHGLNLDWKRFVTHQTRDFMRHEIAAVRRYAPTLPVTTNLMGSYPGLDYWELAGDLDVISWDSYPSWHNPQRPDWQLAAEVAFHHDLNRALGGGRPWLLMESTPSMTNWQEVCKPKRPGMHLLSSLQAVAHGADSVQYFQWRKSRGSCEKLHGAVVDHCGHEHTRVFRDVAEVGRVLAQLDDVAGAAVPAAVAVIFDWENRWAIEDAQGPRRDKGYLPACLAQHRALWQLGIATDVIREDVDFDRYKLVVAPMLYMLKPGVAERLERFVRQGGTLVTTYWSGIVNESDLCFLGGFPGPLRPLLGIWVEETDSLYPGELRHIEMSPQNGLGMGGAYVAHELCDVIHAEGAEVLATYADDYYAGQPALTRHACGQGTAYHLAARLEDAFHDAFYSGLCAQLGIPRALAASLPIGVSAVRRNNGTADFVFLMNFTPQEQDVSVADEGFRDQLSAAPAAGTLKLGPYGVRILRRG